MIENDHNVQSNQYRYVCSTPRHLLKTEDAGRSPEDQLPLVSARPHLIWGQTKIKSMGVLNKSKCAHMHMGLAASDRYLQIFLCSLKFSGEGLQNQSHGFTLSGVEGWGDPGEVPPPHCCSFTIRWGI